MKRFIRTFFILALSCTAALAELTHAGASLTELDAAVAATEKKVLMMSLPASGGFTPNINVQIQQYDKSMQDYIELSKGQLNQMFDQNKWNNLFEKQDGEKEYRLEVSGTLQTKALHFYVRVIKRDAKVYLLTATAGDEQWSAVGKQLKDHVDSIKAE